MLETQPQTPQTVPPAEPEATPLVTLSDAAVAKLTELTKDETDPNVGLRVYVYSGGCSGYRYGMMLEDQPAEEDVRVQSKGISVYVDPQSTQVLMGSEIDYVDTLMGAGFTVNNPNAVSGCGCGSSFRTEESAGAPGACGH
ncbi:MAG TPA: iron-sulfur cluster insertion protein ErpA [Anaerolineae bacterium]|nr:iron-sulfur cluster insertion protein ErpA [Anaerolineae bacterium]